MPFIDSKITVAVDAAKKEELTRTILTAVS